MLGIAAIAVRMHRQSGMYTVRKMTILSGKRNQQTSRVKTLNEQKTAGHYQVRTKPVSWKRYLATYGVMLLMTGGQMTFLVDELGSASNDSGTSPLVKLFIIMAYWAIMSLLFCIITSRQIISRYDVPMQKLSQAAGKVAGGDFSVYLEPLHTPEKYDYIDATFLDFNKMVEELGSIETLKNDFVANVSHEIKTPVAVIQNYAAAIKNEELTPEQRAEYSDTIINASQRLTELITNILKLNKLDNQEIVPVAEPYDLSGQLAECAVQFVDLFDKKGITFEPEFEDEVTIYADESMMEIVWNNLLSNALKFTGPGGTITMRQTSDAGGVTVTVTDTGCGMTEDVAKRIFDKFYQGDTSHASQGNGLGLALAVRVIQRVNGTISVESEVGKGTTFIVKIPLKKP